MINPLTLAQMAENYKPATPQQGSSTGATIGTILGDIPVLGGIASGIGSLFGAGPPPPPPGNAFGIQWLPYNGDPGVVGEFGLILLATGLVLVGTLALVTGPVTNVATEAASSNPETAAPIVIYRGLRRKKNGKPSR